MVTRVSTPGTYGAVLANLMSAENRQIDAGNQVATQKKGDSLKSYAQNAELLTSMRTVQSRLKVYQDQNAIIGDRLATQDAALSQVTDAAASVRQVIADALASGRADGLLEDMRANLRNAVDGLNTSYGGKYLFGGGKIDTKPVSVTEMGDLTGPPDPPVDDFFHNDEFVTRTKLSDSTTIDTGFLASDLGKDMMAAFQVFQQFEEGATGGFNGQLTTDQKNFLQSQLSVWDGIRTDLTSATARNGLAQEQVEKVGKDLVTRANSLEGMMGDITDADMPMAITQLQMAQTAVQAAAQVFASLQSSSLMNFLK